MIVKNEAANIERCLVAAAPVISAWVICDTGSTDDTAGHIERFFRRRDIPGELHHFPFINFEHARNEALERARRSPLAFDYLLLADADMELVIEDPDFRAGLSAPCYAVRQQNEIAYFNTRLLRRDADARYKGVTHEFLDTGGAAPRLAGIWFIDRASGANRAGKFERDARLLEEALTKDPTNARHMFYLAQSRRDAGRL
ncbi:MAG: glycosyl transferase, partial [Betaproteobacteria bacterium]